MINFKSLMQAARQAVKKVVTKKDSFLKNEQIATVEKVDGEKHPDNIENEAINPVITDVSPEKITQSENLIIPVKVIEGENVELLEESSPDISDFTNLSEVSQVQVEIVKDEEQVDVIIKEYKVAEIEKEVSIPKDITSSLIVHLLNASPAVMVQLDNALSNCMDINTKLIKEPGNSVKFRFEPDSGKSVEDTPTEISIGANTYIESIIYNHYNNRI